MVAAFPFLVQGPDAVGEPERWPAAGVEIGLAPAVGGGLDRGPAVPDEVGLVPAGVGEC